MGTINLTSEQINQILTYPKRRRNLLVNGDMCIAQKSDIFPITFQADSSVITYITDKYLTGGHINGGVVEATRIIDANKYWLKITTTTAFSSLTEDHYHHGVLYKFENSEVYSHIKAGTPLVLSFDFKSNVTGDFPVAFRYFNRSDNTWSTFMTSFTYSTADSEERVSVSVDLQNIPNASDLLSNCNAQFDFVICGVSEGNFQLTDTTQKDQWVDGNYISFTGQASFGSNDNDYYQLTHIQLEVGSVATPFEHPVPHEEILLCQRNIQTRKILGSGVYDSDNKFLCTFIPSVPMLQIGSISIYTRSGGYTNINIEHIDTYDVNQITIYFNTSDDLGDKYLDSVGVSGIIVDLQFPSRSGATGKGGVVWADRNADYFIIEAKPF